jgi:hypothetical protein
MAPATPLQRNGIDYLLIEIIGTVDHLLAVLAVAQHEQQNFQRFDARYLAPVSSNGGVRVYRFNPVSTAP